jgi:hypothetical protein
MVTGAAVRQPTPQPMTSEVRRQFCSLAPLGRPATVPAADEDLGVVHEPVDGRGRDRLGHQFVEPGRGWMLELIAIVGPLLCHPGRAPEADPTLLDCRRKGTVEVDAHR